MLHQAFLRLKTGFSQFLLILEFLYTDYHFDPIGINNPNCHHSDRWIDFWG